MSASSSRVAGQLAAFALGFVSFALGCAEESSGEKLDPDTLYGVPTTAGNAGTAGSAAVGGGGSGGAPAQAGNQSGGMAGALTAGSGGSAAGSGGAGSGSGGAGSGSGGAAAGAGGSAGSGGTAGMAGAGGQAAMGHRFVKLVATSEQMGNPWSSIAELSVMTTGGKVLSRGGWVVTADSQEMDDEQAPVTAIVDGDANTFWHTAWEPAPDQASDAPLPHWVVVDLGATQPVTGFQYWPRQTGTNGRIKDWQWYVSNDGQDWGSPVKTGSFPDGADVQDVTF